MKHFLIKTSKFIIILIVVLFGVQYLVDSFLKSELVCDTTWSRVFKGTIDSDIAIIGNSRAQYHYNSKIISKSTGLSCYNLGLSGTPINIFDIRWQAYINRNRLPSTLIIDVDYNFLGTARGLFESDQYVPYVHENEYKKVAESIEKDFYLDYYLPCYKYKGHTIPILSKFRDVFNKNCDAFLNGYIVNNSNWDNQEWAIFENNRLQEVVDSKIFHDLYANGFNKLTSILEYSKQHNIKVLLVWSPQYIEVQKFKLNQRTYVDEFIKKIAAEYNVDYLNFSNNNLVFDTSNFYNHSHLNYKGASEFSKQIAKHLNHKATL